MRRKMKKKPFPLNERKFLKKSNNQAVHTEMETLMRRKKEKAKKLRNLVSVTFLG